MDDEDRAELDRLRIENAAFRSTLGYIAHFDRATLDVARTLHYDMAAVAKRVLETGEPPKWIIPGT